MPFIVTTAAAKLEAIRFDGLFNESVEQFISGMTAQPFRKPESCLESEFPELSCPFFFSQSFFHNLHPAGAKFLSRWRHARPLKISGPTTTGVSGLKTPMSVNDHWPLGRLLA
jgi:hypothetical protein